MKKLKRQWSRYALLAECYALITVELLIVTLFIWTLDTSNPGVLLALKAIGGFMLFTAILGVFLPVMDIIVAQKKLKLMEGDYSIDAEIIEVGEIARTPLCFSHPFYVVCTATDPSTGETLTFCSGNMHGKERQLEGKHVRVYLDREHPKNYYVEIPTDL